MMRRLTGAAAAAVAGSLVLGWWTAAVVGAIYGAVRPSARAGREAAVALALAWGAMLAVRAVVSPLGPLAALLGGVVPIGAAGMLVATILFGALLAGSAAALTAALRRTPPLN